jgi:hypothetical protein
MPNWKKLIVSGSDATLNSLNVNTNVTANVISAETINATTFNTLVVSSSILFTSGSNRIGDELSDNHQITGSVLITGSLSLNGTYIVPSSYTSLDIHNASSSSIASDINTLLIASGTLDTKVTALEGYSYRQPITGSASYTITHDLNEDYPIVQIYDTYKNQVIPAEITSSTSNQVQLEFNSVFNGTVVIKK